MAGSISDNIFIGAACIKRDTNVLVADESVYRYLGQNSSVYIAEYIHEDEKTAFMAFVERCDDTFKTFTANCRRFTGDYTEISFVIKNVHLKEGTFIECFLYDIKQMAKYYKNLDFNNTGVDAYLSLTDDIVFIYNPENKQITLRLKDKLSFI